MDVHPKREREEQTERKREDEFERRDDRQMQLLQRQSTLTAGSFVDCEKTEQ